jgi:two-component system sensor histidine kinase KdpD
MVLVAGLAARPLIWASRRVTISDGVAHLVLALGAIAAATAALYWLAVTDPTTVALSLLLVILVIATHATRRVAVAASLLAFFCFNFFFLPPLGTLAIADPSHWVPLVTLLAVSLVAGHLSTMARRRAEEAAAERHRANDVRRTAELKSALLAALGHDLKTPLTAVTVAANNLNADWLDDQGRREQAAIVLEEAGRLNRIFDDIVDMARIETHAIDAEPEWVQPSEIVEAAAHQAATAIASHDLRVTTTSEPVLVRVDPRLMSAALAHLLENAGQYSPEGGAIEVSAETTDGELRIAVGDRGHGIDARDLDRIFERGYRGDEARQRRYGTGMGLAITRGLLAAMGGRAWASNRAGGGAVFSISVPAARRDARLEGEP